MSTIKVFHRWVEMHEVSLYQPVPDSIFSRVKDEGIIFPFPPVDRHPSVLRVMLLGVSLREGDVQTIRNYPSNDFIAEITQRVFYEPTFLHEGTSRWIERPIARLDLKYIAANHPTPVKIEALARDLPPAVLSREGERFEVHMVAGPITRFVFHLEYHAEMKEFPTRYPEHEAKAP